MDDVRLAIANYKADPETPTCTTDVDPTWTKVRHYNGHRHHHHHHHQDHHHHHDDEDWLPSSVIFGHLESS